MAKLHPDSHGLSYWHWCPGCEQMHRLPEGWEFNNQLDSPKFSPSFKHTWNPLSKVCHYFVIDGELWFCSDSTHKLANQTVSLPDIPAGEIERWGL